ncbi:putative bifunctional diguanylate cyclase/phosphodiesterase [Coralliovum pocilloporae]|uniref:putative bifunctional diguanylate cyclase/phosphodiesterase n=1 Tax=Coralliovum pocilloporae TaxID=3066369 RepID=UPI0033070DF9
MSARSRIGQKDSSNVVSLPGSENGARERQALSARLRLLEDSVIPVWVFDIDKGHVCWTNDKALTLWNAETREDLLARDMGSEMSPTVSRRLKQYQQDFHDGATFSELWTLYPGGEPVTVRCMFRGVLLDDGRMAMLCEAIAEDSQTPDVLRSAQALLHTRAMISLFDEHGELLYENPAARQSRADNTKTLTSRLIRSSDKRGLTSALKRRGERCFSARVQTTDGVRTHEIDARMSRDSVTGEPAILVTEVDVTEREAAEQKIAYLAHHDILTGLYNRTYLTQEMNAILDRADEDQKKVALLFIDLDRFKHINDSLGHAVGDELLVMVSRRLRSCVRKTDVLARLGGDEFVVLLTDIDEHSNASQVANSILAALARPMTIGERDLQVTPSIGISLYPNDGENIDEMLKNADLAMYESKDGGRNQYSFFAPYMNEQAESRLELESSLRKAVDNGEFELFYQPRVSVAENKIVGAEALIRWRHPELGIRQPGEFIAVAEETGLIEPIGEWVMENAAIQQRIWHALGHDITVSVNLSPRQFHSKELIPAIRRLANMTDCDPSRFELEITESMLMGDNEQLIKELKHIEAMGFQLAIDDFGTGYSNLGYLQRYPISCLKIDRSFMQDPDLEAIAGVIINMCQLLDVKIVAEGVERESQLQWLAERGCHEYQGYLFSPPLPVQEFEKRMVVQPVPGGTFLIS